MNNFSGVYFSTKLGQLILGDTKEFLSKNVDELEGKVNLIITSPPFPLNAKKKYGNRIGEVYKDWLTSLAPLLSRLLSPTGSIVMEIGNSWEPNRPVQSLLHLESLMGFVKNQEADLRLIQEFICYNPSRLPSPAQWVTVNRVRTVDSYTHVWWMAKSDLPKADNSKVLRPYSKSMLQLLKKQKYNAGKRPSEHVISKKGFLKDNGGSIAHNLFEMEQIEVDREVRLPHNVLSFSNTISNDNFSKKCRDNGIIPHPARMSSGLVKFFIDFLTDQDDLVFDPFAGSNTTGCIAEQMNRNWLSVEIDESYACQSKFRFQ